MAAQLSFIKWPNINPNNVEKVFRSITYYSVFNDVQKDFESRGIRGHSIYSTDRNDCFLGLIPFFFSQTIKKEIYDQVERTGQHGVSALQVSSIAQARHFLDTAELPEGFFDSNPEEGIDILEVIKEVFLNYCTQGDGVYGSIVTFTWRNGNAHVGMFAMVHNGTEITDIYILDPQALQFGKDAHIHFSKNEACIDVFKSAKHIQFMVSTKNVTHKFPNLKGTSVTNNHIDYARRTFRPIDSRQGSVSNTVRPQSAESPNRPIRTYHNGENRLYELNRNSVNRYRFSKKNRRNRRNRDNENGRAGRPGRFRTPSPNRNRRTASPSPSDLPDGDWNEKNFFDLFGGGIESKKSKKSKKSRVK